MTDAKSPSLAMRLMRAGLTKTYAYKIMAGERVPSVRMALTIHRNAGLKLGPLANLSDSEIAVLAKMHGEGA